MTGLRLRVRKGGRRGVSKQMRAPLVGDFEGGEENEEEGFGYKEISHVYPIDLGEERLDNLDAAVTPMNIAIGAAVLLIGIGAIAYFVNKNNPQAEAEHPNIL